jgi:hypothetical protein
MLLTFGDAVGSVLTTVDSSVVNVAAALITDRSRPWSAARLTSRVDLPR